MSQSKNSVGFVQELGDYVYFEKHYPKESHVPYVTNNKQYEAKITFNGSKNECLKRIKLNRNNRANDNDESGIVRESERDRERAKPRYAPGT